MWFLWYIKKKVFCYPSPPPRLLFPSSDSYTDYPGSSVCVYIHTPLSSSSSTSRSIIIIVSPSTYVFLYSSISIASFPDAPPSALPNAINSNSNLLHMDFFSQLYVLWRRNATKVASANAAAAAAESHHHHHQKGNYSMHFIYIYMFCLCPRWRYTKRGLIGSRKGTRHWKDIVTNH